MANLRSVAARSPALSPWLPVFSMSLATFATSLLVLGIVTLNALAPTRAGSLSVVPGDDGGDAADPPVLTPPAAPALGSDRAPGSVELATDPLLRAAVEQALGSSISDYGVVVRRLRDGRGVAINASETFYAASTFKLAVLYEVERRISEGLIHESDRIYLTDADVVEDLGTLGDVPVANDGSISIGEALRAMVTLSDNSTAVALLHSVGAANIDASLAKLGLEHTSVNTHDLPTTAADMALLMEAIVTGRGLNDAARREARQLLLEQRTRDGIPSGLPPGALVGNKTGTWEDATHDIAFVDAPGGVYVIAVLSDRSWAWQPISAVSKAVYETMTAPR